MGGAEAPATTGRVSAFGLVAVGFFWVSGGSYGNEALVLSAPPGLLLFGISIVGLCYGIPLALITAELGTGWPVAGGMAQWVEIACGPVLGAHNAWWIWVSYVFDSAIYPVLASHYLAATTDITPTQQSLYATFIVAVMTAVKLMGRSVLERLSTLLAVLTLTPSVIYMSFGVSHVDLSYLASVEDDPCTRLATQQLCTAPNASSCTWSEHPLLGAPEMAGVGSADGQLVDDSAPGCEGLNLSLLLSYIMWLYSGFVSLGSLAGELEDPVRSYWLAILMLVPLVLIVNCMPLIVSMSLDHDRNHFQPGHFQVLATGVVGHWMKAVYFTGSQISLYGLYNSTIITAECTLPPFFEKYIFRRKPSAEDTGMRAFCLRGKGEEEPGVFYVLLNALLCAGLVWCPYQFLVEVTMLLMVVMTYPFLFAFVLLRISQPDVPRPFKVPGGTIAAVLWTLPPGLLGTAYLYVCMFVTVDHSFGIPYFNILCCAVTVLLGLVVQLGLQLAQSSRPARDDPRESLL